MRESAVSTILVEPSGTERASAVAIAGLGVWQRWVSHPALGRAVIEFDELDAKLPALEPR